jgi:hypothetical protein
MTGLEQIVLEKIDNSRRSVEDFGLWDPSPAETASLTEIEDLMVDICRPCSLINYQCLEFSLESGLGLLAGMKELRTLHVKSTARRIAVEELRWMQVNWPKLREIKGLMLARGWAGQGEDEDTEVEAWMVGHLRGIGSSFYPRTVRT